MKTIATLLIGCSLALAGAVIAQQPEGQESPAKKGGRAEKTTQGATETKPKSNAGETRGNTRASAESNVNQPGTTGETGAMQGKGKRARGMKDANATGASAESSPGAAGSNAAQTETGKRGKYGRNAKQNATAETGAAASPGQNQPVEAGKKNREGRNAKTANASPSPAASATVAANTYPATTATVAGGMAGTTNATGATGTTNAQGSTGTTAMTKEQGTVGRGGKKVEQQQVQQIKYQHASFRAQPRPDKAPAVTFQANRRIEGSEHWQGSQYEVFRSYHPQWHDQGWYHSHYGRVELIAGGYYFFNAGYWYPAWGYDQSAAYYPYDGPIYVGHQAEPPDRVIADVQAELQEMGYYTGEVDGLLGPLTRQALRDYQNDHGLIVTEAIDEPTLDALQMG